MAEEEGEQHREEEEEEEGDRGRGWRVVVSVYLVPIPTVAASFVFSLTRPVN